MDIGGAGAGAWRYFISETTHTIRAYRTVDGTRGACPSSCSSRALPIPTQGLCLAGTSRKALPVLSKEKETTFHSQICPLQETSAPPALRRICSRQQEAEQRHIQLPPGGLLHCSALVMMGRKKGAVNVDITKTCCGIERTLEGLRPAVVTGRALEVPADICSCRRFHPPGFASHNVLRHCTFCYQPTLPHSLLLTFGSCLIMHGVIPLSAALTKRTLPLLLQLMSG